MLSRPNELVGTHLEPYSAANDDEIRRLTKFLSQNNVRNRRWRASPQGKAHMKSYRQSPMFKKRNAERMRTEHSKALNRISQKKYRAKKSLNRLRAKDKSCQ
jgi:hypothetical protein